MRSIFLILAALCVSIDGYGQERRDEILPLVGDVTRVSFIDTSPGFYTADTLMAVLPRLMLSPDKTRDPRGRYQSGTFEMKDGSSIKWFAGDDRSLYIRTATEMKYFAIPTASEIDEFLMLPKAEDVDRIVISNSVGNWYTSDSLLKALPYFVVGGGYKPKMLWQLGEIKLKNGKLIHWKAYSGSTLVIYFRHGEKYFELKKSN